MPTFWEKDIWTIDLEPQTRMLREDALCLLAETAWRTCDPRIGLAGVLIDHGKSREVSQMYLVDDPSYTYGPTPYEAVSTLADDMASRYNMLRMEWLINSADSRFLGALRRLNVFKNMRLGFSIMGVDPGYGKQEDVSPPLSYVDVEGMLPLGSTIEVDRGHLFSARYGRELWHEPAVVFAGSVGELTETVPQIANELLQQRVVIKTPGKSIVYARSDNDLGVAYESNIYSE